MNWKTLTVAHYQALFPALTSQMDDLDRMSKIVGVLFDMTDEQVDALPMSQYKRLASKSAFLNEPITGHAPKYIHTKSRKYKVVYDVEQMPVARYTEVKQFRGETETDYINNIHKVLASMVVPMKRILGVWVEGKYDDTKHSEYASDLLDASFQEVFNACVFFCHQYTALIKASPAYLLNQLMATGMTPEQAWEQNIILQGSLDGFIISARLPSMRGYQQRRLGRYLRSVPLTPSLT